MNTLKKITNNISKVIIGKDESIELAAIALIAKGHILLEDVPGTGKTTLAKSLAKSVDAKFQRIQFTADTLPGDVIGLEYFNVKESDFKTRLGPIFANIVLVDEINRAVPRTQSSLLEVMEERTVTIAKQTHSLPEPFLLAIRQGYPTREAEKEMMNRFQMNDPLETLHSIISSEEIIMMQKRAREVLVGNDVQDYLLEIIEATRKHELIEIGVSPRGTLAFMRAIQARAILNERDYCTPDDIKTLAASVCAHRLTLTIEGEMKTTKEQIMREILHTINVPVENIR
ncbi:AAA family ATPase [Bacillus cereus group sp. MYBK87-2]|uniref:AAA family ATPase n=1 Tax=unclassified Bacillus cereus group TaxID=2750818 RepID=UPI003F78BFCE